MMGESMRRARESVLENRSALNGSWRSFRFLFLALLATSLLISCSRAGQTVWNQSASGTSPDNTIPVVPAAKVTRTELSNEISLTGEFQPYQEVDLMAKVSGYVKTIRVDIGDQVRVGELLATLEIP